MRFRQGMSSASALALCYLLASDLFVSYAAAQDLPTLSKSDANNAMPTASSDSAAASKTSAAPASKSASATGSQDSKPATTGNSASDSKSGVVTITGGSSASDTADPTSIPLPTSIAGQYSYPPPSVPPTANAPYMQHSNLPEGTIFIAVGAGLGFFALAVLAWRGLVAWSLHRSVRRAAMQQSVSDQKTFFRPPGGGKLYSSTVGSSLSIDRLAHGGRKDPAPNAGSHRASAPSESLFFSPTAARGSVAGIDTVGNRASGYLPAGYYAAGNSAPGGSGNGNGNGGGPGSGMSQLGTGIMSIGPKSQGYSRARSMGPSPPGSPGLRPTSRGGDSLYSRGGQVHGGAGSSSVSNTNLNAPPQGRAPSAYLEDLFETHQARPDSSGRF